MPAGQIEDAEVEQAIGRVLQAEREAQEAVARCKAECAQRVADAHRRAGETAVRAEQRIARLREAIGAAVERQIAEIGGAVEPEQAGKPVADAGRRHLERAAAAVARELTGMAE